MPLSASFMRGWLHLQLRLFVLLGSKRQALACTGGLLERSPDDVHALASRAHLLATLNRHTEAVPWQARVVALRPAQAGAWFNLGFLCEACGDLAQAEMAFSRAVALDPRLDRAWYGLALTLVRLGRDDEAQMPLERNTELQPMSPYGWYQLAMLHARRNDGAAASRVIEHLRGFEPRVARQLEQELGQPVRAL